MWFSVVCTLVDNDTRHHSGQNVVQKIELHHKALCFALVIEYVSSIHPWANSRCPINQSEHALCFSYVINLLRAENTITSKIIRNYIHFMFQEILDSQM